MVVIAAALSELHNRIRVDFCFNWNLDKRGFLIKEGARGEFGFSLKAHFLYGRYLCFNISSMVQTFAKPLELPGFLH